jgi:hypothetical protein
MTSIRRQTDVRINNAIEHAVSLSYNRLPHARELFTELRPYLDTLSASDELFQRGVFIEPRALFCPIEGELIWHSQWPNLPWLAAEELEAIEIMMFGEFEGARDQSIIFSDDAMTVTIYGFPLHSPAGVNAWLGISYRDSLIAHYPEHEVIMVEPLESNWYLTIYAEVHSNIAQPFVVGTIILAVMTVILLSIYIWGSKTGRFH